MVETTGRASQAKMSVIRIFETGKIAREGSIWPIWFVTLGGGFQMLQAAQRDGLSFDGLASS